MLVTPMKSQSVQLSPSRDAGVPGPRREADGSWARPSVVSRSATAFCFVEPQRGEMFVAPGPPHLLPSCFSAAPRSPLPKAPSAWRSPGHRGVGRGRWKVAKRLGVRQSPAAFPRRRVGKVVI
jgi:hypothetical protein